MLAKTVYTRLATSWAFGGNDFEVYLFTPPASLNLFPLLETRGAAAAATWIGMAWVAVVRVPLGLMTIIQVGNV